MSPTHNGFFWQSNDKHDKTIGEWIGVVMELSGPIDRMELTLTPNEQIYEAVDEDERKQIFKLSAFKRCYKIKHRVTPTQRADPTVKTQPTYQLLLMKGRILSGEQLRLGFGSKEDTLQFMEQIKHTVKHTAKNRHTARIPRFSKCNAGSPPNLGCDINEIADYMTENWVYEGNCDKSIRVQVIRTDLSDRLKINGIYLLDFEDCHIRLLDYISGTELNKWSIKSIRSFGFNEGRIYLLTGSRCVGGRGLLIFETTKSKFVVDRLIAKMHELAGETPSSTEHTEPYSRGTPYTQTTKKSMQDLSASLQDFCRSHCCTFSPTRGRKDETSKDEGVESEDGLTKEIADANLPSGTDDDALSLDEIQEVNVDGLECDIDQRLSLSKEVEDNTLKRSDPSDKAPTPKDSRRRALRTSSLKKSILELFMHNSPQASDRPGPSHSVPEVAASGVLATDLKTHSLSETPQSSSPFFEARRAVSTKAIQLIKWRDLPGKDDCLTATNGEPIEAEDRKRESDYRGSDIVSFLVEQQERMGDEEEGGNTPSMRETGTDDNTTSVPSSSSTMRDRQLTAALVASTAF